MRLLKLLTAILFLLILTVIAGLFLPKEFKASATIEVNARPEIVYSQISALENWKNWSPWLNSDSANAISFEENNKLVWENTSGKHCEIVLTHRDEWNSIAANYRVDGESMKTFVWLLEVDGNNTKVNWSLGISKLSFLERYFALFSVDDAEQVLDSGLVNLRVTSEALKYSRISTIQEIDSLPVQPAVVMVDSVIEAHVSERLSEMDRYLKRFLDRRGIQPIDSVFYMHYGKVNDTLFKIAAGYPMPERTWVWRTLKYDPQPEGKAVVVTHLGSDFPQNAYDTAEKYMNEKGYKPNGQPWHIEKFKRETAVDSTLWETKVYFPVIRDTLKM